MERYESLITCDDVFALAKRGIGESLTLDYKEKLSGKRLDLAADVCALANTQGGVLVVGVKDPKPEGAPPKYPEDFVGVTADEDLVHRVESHLLDAINPRVFPEVRATRDTYERDGKEKCFLLVQVPASPELHQVTVERDFKHYRRAEYQNRAMSSDEIRRRVEEILAAQRGISALFEEEISRLSKIMAGPYTVFLAAPTVGHRLAIDPADPAVRSELTLLGRNSAQPYTEGPLTSSAEFQPAGDGVRTVGRLHSYQSTTECRVRRDSLISHGQSHNAIDPERFLVERHSSMDELWREREGRATEYGSRLRQMVEAWDQASTTMGSAPAVRLWPIILRRKIAGFLDFVHGVYELGGWHGAIRFDLQVVSPDAYPAVDSPEQPGRRASGEKFYFLHLSETPTLRATTEFQYKSLENGKDDLVEETMRRIAHHFGMDQFPLSPKSLG
jgi:hypothetical protein